MERPVVREPPRPKLHESRVRLPHRGYLVFSGAVAQADGPDLCRPADHAWCMASEIDLDYSLVGGTTELCTELIAAGASEARPEERS